MKKFQKFCALLLSAAMMLALAACGSSSETAEEEEVPPEEETAEEPEAVPDAEPEVTAEAVPESGIAFEIVEAEEAPSDEAAEPEEAAASDDPALLSETDLLPYAEIYDVFLLRTDDAGSADFLEPVFVLDDDVVLDVSADASGVNAAEVGIYDVLYTLLVDLDAYDRSLSGDPGEDVIFFDPYPADGAEEDGAEEEGTVLVVSADEVNVRSGPGTGYDILGTCGEGTEILAVGEEDGWYAFAYDGDVTGYILGDYLTEAPVSGEDGEEEDDGGNDEDGAGLPDGAEPDDDPEGAAISAREGENLVTVEISKFAYVVDEEYYEEVIRSDSAYELEPGIAMSLYS